MGGNVEREGTYCDFKGKYYFAGLRSIDDRGGRTFSMTLRTGFSAGRSRSISNLTTGGAWPVRITTGSAEPPFNRDSAGSVSPATWTS